MSPKYDGELEISALSDANNTHARVLSLVGNGKRVLEIGCATGYMTKAMIQKQKCQVTALEIDPQAARLARRSGAEVFTGDIQQAATISQLGGPFDVIIMADVLEHLKDPEIVVSHLHPLIRPGGSLVVSVPNVAHWTMRAGLLRGHFDYVEKGILDSSHLRFFTRKSILKLFHDCGYHLDRFEATYVFPLHGHHGLGHFFATRGVPGWVQEIFAYQFIVRAAPA